MGKRMAMWSEKHLSAAAKELLIKAIAQAIPTYTMSIFHLSASFCEELAHGVRRYWWGEDDDNRRTHWIAWKSSTNASQEEGWGSGISRYSIRIYWQSKHGGSLSIQRVCVQN
jgi:hypothetical protein